jgi:hypothetical protein
VAIDDRNRRRKRLQCCQDDGVGGRDAGAPALWGRLDFSISGAIHGFLATELMPGAAAAAPGGLD